MSFALPNAGFEAAVVQYPSAADPCEERQSKATANCPPIASGLSLGWRTARKGPLGQNAELCTNRAGAIDGVAAQAPYLPHLLYQAILMHLGTGGSCVHLTGQEWGWKVEVKATGAGKL